MTFYCTQCRRDRLDVMIDGEVEMMDGTSVCTKCAYCDWTAIEQAEIDEKNRIEDMGGNYCACRGGCEYCLDVEPRIMGWRD